MLASALPKVGLVVKFANGHCKLHDLIDGDIIFASNLICCGHYNLDGYEEFMNEGACIVFDTQAMPNAKL